MGKHTVARVLLAGARGVRPADFLFLFNSDCLVYFCVETTQIRIIWVPNTAPLCYF